jgi:hypothetical protein
MSIASGLACRIVGYVGGLGTPVRLALLMAVLAVGAVTVGLLLPAPEPIIVAPFRWRQMLV